MYYYYYYVFMICRERKAAAGEHWSICPPPLMAVAVWEGTMNLPECSNQNMY